MTLESADDFEVLRIGGFGGFDEFTNAGAVNGDGFLDEGVFSLRDGVFEVGGAESGRRAEEDEVGGFDGFLVGVEAVEDAFGGDVYAVWKLFFECFGGLVGVVLESIGDGDELGAGAIEGLGGGTGSASAASDEGYFDFRGIALCVDESGEKRGSSDERSCFEEAAAVGMICNGIHVGFYLRDQFEILSPDLHRLNFMIYAWKAKSRPPW